MKWLVIIQQEIQGHKASPQEQRDASTLLLNELAALCDRWAPQAAAPIFYCDESWGRVGWWSPDDQRLLSLVTHNGTITLHLQDGDHKSDTTNPSHEQIKVAVQSFFERTP